MFVLSGACVCAVVWHQRAAWTAFRQAAPEDYVSALNPRFDAVRSTWDCRGRTLVLGEAEAFYFAGDVLYSTPYDRGALAAILRGAETGSQPDVFGRRLSDEGIECIYIDVAELARTGKRYRPDEASLFADVPGTVGESFVKWLQCHCQLRYNGGGVFVYAVPRGRPEGESE